MFETKYIRKHKKQALRELNHGYARMGDIFQSLANREDSREIINFQAKPNDAYTLTVRQPQLALFSYPIFDVQVSVPDLVAKVSQGYVDWATGNGFLIPSGPSSDMIQPDESKMRMERTFMSQRGFPLSYSIRVDGSYNPKRKTWDAEKETSIDLPAQVSIVPEIGRKRRFTALDGHVAMIVNEQEDKSRLERKFKEDMEVVKDAFNNLDFVYSTHNPGSKAGSAVYSVCLDPQIVGVDGLAQFLDKALGLGLKPILSVEFRDGKKDHAKLTFSLRRESGRDYAGLTFSGEGYLVHNVVEQGFKMLGNVDRGPFLDMPIEYDLRTSNPRWTESNELSSRRLRNLGHGIVTGLKWSSVPFWGIPVLGIAATKGIIHAVNEREKRIEAEQRRLYDRIGDHLNSLYVQTNKRQETCVIGVSTRLIDEMKDQLKEEKRKTAQQTGEDVK